MRTCAVCAALAVLMCRLLPQVCSLSSNVFGHLSTKTSYHSRLPVPLGGSSNAAAPSIHDLPDPKGYEPLHLWLIARHGTRWPTKDRMRQINSITRLFQDARNTKDHPWIRNWQSPFINSDVAGGELHTKGEDEMWGLAQRMASRFPSLLDKPYLPHRYPVVSSQVHRAAASASAFTSGFFPPVEVNTNDLAPVPPLLQAPNATSATQSSSKPSKLRPQAVAMTMLPKHADPVLRFFDVCPAYAQRELWLESWLPLWMEVQWSKLIPQLQERLGLTRKMAPDEVEDVWQLCQFQAGVQGVTNEACSLLSDSDVRLLEWVSDVHLIEAQSYGSPINYQIAAPLLHELRKSLKHAAHSASKADDGHAERHVQLMFAHCETLVPLASLLGLFKPDQQQQQQQQQGRGPAQRLSVARGAQSEMDALLDVDALEDLEYRQLHGEGHSVQKDEHPFIPQNWQPLISMDNSRTFRGGFVSPFSANMGLVLYKRSDDEAARASRTTSHPDFLVRLLYNEQVLPVPGCNRYSSSNSSSSSSSSSGIGHDSDLDCDLDEFLDRTAVAAGARLEELCGGEGSAAAAS